MIVDGIKYEKVNGQVYEMLLFEETEIEAYANRMCDIGNGIYDCVEVESDTERVLAEAMSGRQDIKLLIKLPDWFQVETPIGTYNPDWAIFRHGPAPAVRLCAARGPNLTATLSLPA
jgi:type III restriction enzyme